MPSSGTNGAPRLVSRPSGSDPADPEPEVDLYTEEPPEPEGEYPRVEYWGYTLGARGPVLARYWTNDDLSRGYTGYAGGKAFAEHTYPTVADFLRHAGGTRAGCGCTVYVYLDGEPVGQEGARWLVQRATALCVPGREDFFSEALVQGFAAYARALAVRLREVGAELPAPLLHLLGDPP